MWQYAKYIGYKCDVWTMAMALVLRLIKDKK